MFFKLASTLMGAMGRMPLLDGESTGPAGDIKGGAQKISGVVVATVKSVLVPILSIIGVAGVIWAIVLGVQMARADSTEKREECKKRLIGLIVGIVVMIVLIIIFLFFDDIVKWFPGIGDTENIDPNNPGGQEGMVKAFLTMFKR